MDVGDLDLVGCGPKGIGELLQSGSAGGDSFKGIDVVTETPDGESHQGFPPPGSYDGHGP